MAEQTGKRLCRCGHAKSEHNRSTGPNSNGLFFHNQCKHGWHHSTGHLFRVRGACLCNGFRLRWWWPWRSR